MLSEISGRNGRIRHSRNWEPVPPKFRFKEKGKYLFTKMSVNIAPGVQIGFTSRVDMDLIEQEMRQGKYDEISGIFGSIFRGIKKTVKSVARATGIDKVVKVAGKVLKNPIIRAVVPGAALAAGGLSIANDISKATGLSRSGRRGSKKKARAYLRRAAMTAQRHRLGRRATGAHALQGGKVYQLIIQPK